MYVKVGWIQTWWQTTAEVSKGTPPIKSTRIFPESVDSYLLHGHLVFFTMSILVNSLLLKQISNVLWKSFWEDLPCKVICLVIIPTSDGKYTTNLKFVFPFIKIKRKKVALSILQESSVSSSEILGCGTGKWIPYSDLEEKSWANNACVLHRNIWFIKFS